MLVGLLIEDIEGELYFGGELFGGSFGDFGVEALVEEVDEEGLPEREGQDDEDEGASEESSWPEAFEFFSLGSSFGGGVGVLEAGHSRDQSRRSR